MDRATMDHAMFDPSNDYITTEPYNDTYPFALLPPQE